MIFFLVRHTCALLALSPLIEILIRTGEPVFSCVNIIVPTSICESGGCIIAVAFMPH